MCSQSILLKSFLVWCPRGPLYTFADDTIFSILVMVNSLSKAEHLRLEQSGVILHISPGKSEGGE
jgi:hypothetical protein